MIDSNGVNTANVRKHIEFLRANSDLGFNMGAYSPISKRKAENPKEICGTVSSSLGWAPMWSGVKGYDFHNNGGWFDYDPYSVRVFGHMSGDVWNWFFGVDWMHADNTIEGAWLRMEWYLAHGLPDDWWGQMMGEAPLCYQTEGA